MLLLFVLPLLTARAYAYDFSAVCETGQTLYYNITDAENHKVELTCPSFDDLGHGSWDGYEKPEGDILLPETAEYDGVAYSVTSIGDYAFYYCSGLTGSLVIPNTVTSIGDYAFYRCQRFSGALEIPNSVTSIGDYAFYYCYGLTGSLVIPNTVTSIGDHAFYYCQRFSGSLEISNSVTSIGDYAFYYCYGLTGSLVIPNSVTSIGDCAFCYCSGLTGSLVIPNSVETIGDAAFSGCEGFRSLSLGNSLTAIGESAFYRCRRFSGSLVIPNSVETIGESAFGYNNFTSLSLGNSLTTIETGTFSYCNSFSGSLVIPNSVETIGDEAFCGCEGFRSLSLGNSLTAIGNSAFESCRNLSGSLIIPNSVTTIGDYAFSECESLTSLSLGNSLTSIGPNAFSYCSRLAGPLVIPNSVTAISDNAFADCFGLASLSLGNAVTSIGSNAFQNCGFSSIVSKAAIPPALEDACFGGIIPDISVQVPCGTTEAYSQANGWNEFGNYSEFRNFEIDVLPSDAVMGSVALVQLPDCETGIATVEATAVQGCEFVNWTENGEPVSADATYSFEVTADRSLVANFVPAGIPVVIAAMANPTEGGTIIGVGTYDQMETVTLTAVPDMGYEFDYWSENDAWVSDDQTFAFAAVVDRNLVANFREVAYNFSEVCSTGQTLYYWVSDAPNHKVAITSPNNDDYPWKGYEMPAGEIVLPETVEHDGVTYTVTAIRDHAFYGCGNLTGALVIPNTVTTIGDYAFYICSGFNGSLTIGNSVTTIGDHAFYNCSGFTGDLALGNSVTTIGEWTFSYCRGFSGDLALGNSVTTIGDDAFYNCSGFKGDLTLGNSVTTIGGGAFYGCSGFTGDLTIPNSVTSIGNSAFSGCSGFTGDLTIPNSVTSIGYSVFRDCRGFTGNLVMPNSVTSIGESAFSYCSGFTGDLVIPNSVTSIGNSAFSYCSGFSGDLTIPNSVTSIGNSAFSGCSGFTGDLTIPNSVTSIGNSVFYGCRGFTGDLVIPNSVTSIGDDAFSGCRGFKGDLTLGNSVTTIGGGAFYGCSGFTGDLTIPNSVTSIGNNAFKNCSGFTGDLTLGNSVTTIGEWAFHICSGFTGDLTIPNSVTTIGVGAFCFCSGLSGDLVIPNSVTSIGRSAFYECSGFKGSLTLGNSVTSIGNDAFYNCNGFTGDLIIPNSVTTIGERAFYYCYGFKGSLTLGNSVTSIGIYAFYNCTGFTGDLVIPNSVTSIGIYAFYGCSGFTGNLVIPNSVTSIGTYTFRGCSRFSSITSKADVPPVLGGSSCFYNVPKNIPVYVPCGTSEAYQLASGWYEFNNYLEIRMHEIEVSSSDEIMGSVTLVQLPNCEDGIAIVQATANPDYEFVNWTENGVEVSTDATYSFEATEDRSLVAVFRLSSALVFIGSETDHSWSTASNWNTNALPVETDDVFINGICELEESATVASLTVNAGKSITVKGGNVLSVTGQLATTDASQLVVENGGQLVHNNDALATVKKFINGYVGSNDNYYLIASPVTDNTSVLNLTANEYDLYTFDQSEDLEWRNQHGNAVVAHKNGYLYANSEDVTLEFAGTIAASAEATTLEYVAGKEFAGFNLIGNPFPCNAYIENSYLRMNEEGTALAAGIGAIAPCEAVFVEATAENQSVAFSKTANRVNAINISVSRNRGASCDRAIVRFDGKSDLHKMILNEGNAKLYIPQFGEDFAVVCSQTDEGEMLVNFKTAQNGTYTIAVNTENVTADYLHLIDNMTGEDTDLLAIPTYTFDAKTSDYASRFKLVFSVKGTEPAEVTDTFAFISNGEIIISNEGRATLQLIDAMGRIIRNQQIEGEARISTQGLTAGVYVLTLNGMTQKIVVR